MLKEANESGQTTMGCTPIFHHINIVVGWDYQAISNSQSMCVGNNSLS